MDALLLRYNKDSCFVFLDYETFNLCLSFCHNLPWQLGMIKLTGEKIMETRDDYVKWDTKLKISKQAREITKFDQKKFDARAVAPESVFPVMEQWLDEADYIIGHNILGFDAYLIKEWYRINGKRANHLYPKIIDTNILAKAIKLNVEPPKDRKDLLEWQYGIMHQRLKGKTNLKYLGEEEYKIEHDYENLHDAIIDLSLNVKIWNQQKFILAV